MVATAEMKAFLGSPDAADAPESEAASGAAEGAGESGDVQEGASQEAGDNDADGAEKASEGAGDGEEKVVSKEEAKKLEEDKAKDSSYKRLQKRAEVAKEDSKKARKEAAEALVIANEWRNRAHVLASELKKVVAQAKQSGYNRDSRDDQILASRLRESDHSIKQAAPEYVKKVEEDAEVAELRQQYVETAADLETQYPGITQGEILRAYAVVVESSEGQEDVSMEEVAEMLHVRKTRGKGPQAQLQKNRAAVRPIRSSPTSRPPEFRADRDGMKNYLRSQGLA